MITLKDVKNAVIKVLREGTTIKTITGEDRLKMEYPLLYVQLEPLSSATSAAGLHTDRAILIDITYQQERITSNEELYEMLELLDSLIRPILTVKDRNFTIQNADFQVTDEIGHYTFQINFTDILKEPNDEPLVEHMEIKI